MRARDTGHGSPADVGQRPAREQGGAEANRIGTRASMAGDEEFTDDIVASLRDPRYAGSARAAAYMDDGLWISPSLDDACALRAAFGLPLSDGDNWLVAPLWTRRQGRHLRCYTLQVFPVSR